MNTRAFRVIAALSAGLAPAACSSGQSIGGTNAGRLIVSHGSHGALTSDHGS